MRHPRSINLISRELILQTHDHGETQDNPLVALKRHGTDDIRLKTLSLLPLHYGSQLEKTLARQDAFYALSEVFRFAAASEVQFLNLIQNRIENELSFVALKDIGGRNAISLLNLKYLKSQLTSHARNLTENVSTFENLKILDWPRTVSVTIDQTIALLITDFRYLLKRVEDLANECESGMTTLTNSSVMEETRRSAELSVVVWRYTAVAVVFVPLSFVCSFFGMNFAEMGQGELRLWIWFPSHGTRDFALFDYLLLGRVEKVIIKEGIEKCSLDIFPWSFRYSGKVFGS